MFYYIYSFFISQPMYEDFISAFYICSCGAKTSALVSLNVILFNNISWAILPFELVLCWHNISLYCVVLKYILFYMIMSSNVCQLVVKFWFELNKYHAVGTFHSVKQWPENKVYFRIQLYKFLSHKFNILCCIKGIFRLCSLVNVTT